MRIWHRLKTVLPLVLAVSMSASAAAQGIFGTPGGGFPATNAGTAGYSAIGYQGIPPGYQAYPGISPFDNALEQHVNSDGLWYRDTIGHFEPRGRRYSYDVQLEWLNTSVRRFSGNRVGDPNAQTFQQTTENFLVLPTDLVYETYLPPRFGKIPTTRPDGLKLTTTIKSRDGWRFSVNGMWNDRASSEFSARGDRDKYRIDEVDAQILAATGGIGNPGVLFTNQRNTTDLEITETIILNRDLLTFDAVDVELFGVRESTFDVLNRTLLQQFNLPLQNGLVGPGLPDDPIAGVYQRFDIEFAIRQSVQTYGAGAHFESDTLFEHHGIQFRGLLGGRYMRINEGFHFRGTDSGLTYSITNSTNGEQADRIDNDGDFVVDDIEEGGSGDDYIGFNPSDELLIRSFVDNEVESDLGGPELGFAYDLGKKAGIDISGSTRVGALFNQERIRLAGDNIGHFSPLGVIPNLGIDPVTNQVILAELFDTTTANGQLTQNAFTDSSGSTHLSPMFEQSLTATIPLFGRVPVLRDMKLLEQSSLQVGWTFLWIGEVADPSQSIAWESNPRAGLFPTVNVDRDNYYQNTLRLGVISEY